MMRKYTTLAEELSSLPKDRQESIEARSMQIRQEEVTLKHLSLSQADLAQRLEVQQLAISKLERRQNLELNTLKSIINALGGTIQIIVRVPSKESIHSFE